MEKIFSTYFRRLCEKAGLPSTNDARYNRWQCYQIMKVYDTVDILMSLPDDKLSKVQHIIRDVWNQQS